MTNTTTKTVRVTKDMKFEDIANMLQGKDALHGLTVEAALAFIQKERDLLAKKNVSEKRSTATQKENEKHKERILAFLATQSEPLTCVAIAQNIPELVGSTPQKIGPMMNSLEEDKKVTRSMVKGRPYFSLA